MKARFGGVSAAKRAEYSEAKTLYFLILPMDGTYFISGEISDSMQHMQQLLLDTSMHGLLSHMARTAAEVIRNNGKVILAGNGISAAHAQQTALMLGNRIAARRAAMPALAITADGALITAIAKDEGPEKIFSRQIETVGKPGDMFAAFSLTGDEQNIKQALHTAKRKNMICVGFCGQDGRYMTPLCDALIHAPCASPMRVSEVHSLFVSLFASLTEIYYFNEGRFGDDITEESAESDNVFSLHDDKELKEGW